MTVKKAIKILQNELQCIQRNNGINCDRQCEKCDLVLDAQEVEDAYITILNYLHFNYK